MTITIVIFLVVDFLLIQILTRQGRSGGHNLSLSVEIGLSDLAKSAMAPLAPRLQ